MKFSIERDAAVAAVAKAQSVVGKGTIPIVHNLLLTAEGGELAIAGTDLDVQIATQAPAVIDRPGTVTAPASELHEILRSLPAGAEVAFEIDGSRLVVKCARATLRLPTLPAGDFPVFEPPRGETRFSLAAAALERLLAKTSFAMGREATRYHLCAVCLHVVTIDGQALLRAAAVDGQRLALAEEAAPEGCGPGFNILLPARTVGELSRLLAGLTCDVEVSSDGRKVEIALGGVTLTSKLIDGQFPDYPRVLPPPPDHTVSIDSALLASAIKRAAILGQGQKARIVALEFDEGSLRVTARGDIGGDAEEVVECDYSGEPARFTFNAAHLLDALAQLDGRQFDLAIAGSGDPVKFVDPLDGDAFSILMSLRV